MHDVGFARFLTLIACFTSYAKWMLSEMYPSKACLLYKCQLPFGASMNEGPICPWAPTPFRGWALYKVTANLLWGARTMWIHYGFIRLVVIVIPGRRGLVGEVKRGLWWRSRFEPSQTMLSIRRCKPLSWANRVGRLTCDQRVFVKIEEYFMYLWGFVVWVGSGGGDGK